MSDKSRLCGMTQEEVDSYLKEKNIKVAVMMEHGYNKDGDWAEEIRDDKGYFVKFGDDCVKTVQLWGFSSPNGFHTFSWEEPKLTEAKAQYMTVLFHKLYEEYDVSWASAEALAFAYVMSEFEVPYVPIEKRLEPDMTDEEQDVIRREMIIVQEEVRKRLLNCIESGNVVADGVDETVMVRGEERKASEFDKYSNGNVIEDWKD